MSHGVTWRSVFLEQPFFNKLCNRGFSALLSRPSLFFRGVLLQQWHALSVHWASPLDLTRSKTMFGEHSISRAGSLIPTKINM
jgi:hypothetical protein